jgi:hypothetical protein
MAISGVSIAPSSSRHRHPHNSKDKRFIMKIIATICLIAACFAVSTTNSVVKADRYAKDDPTGYFQLPFFIPTD